jgi:hypothetical protein
MHASDVTPGSGTRARRELGRAVLVVAVLSVGHGLLVLALISDVSTEGRFVGATVVIAATGVLAVLIASRHVVRRGLAALVAGVVGVSLGIAIGPVWLVTTGPGAVAFVALACLAAGLLLAGAGTWLRVRVPPGWWRLAALPVAFLLLLADELDGWPGLLHGQGSRHRPGRQECLGQGDRRGGWVGHAHIGHDVDRERAAIIQRHDDRRHGGRVVAWDGDGRVDADRQVPRSSRTGSGASRHHIGRTLVGRVVAGWTRCGSGQSGTPGS